MWPILIEKFVSKSVDKASDSALCSELRAGGAPSRESCEIVAPPRERSDYILHFTKGMLPLHSQRAPRFSPALHQCQ